MQVYMYLYLGRHLFNHYDYEKNLYQYVPVQKFVHFDGKKRIVFVYCPNYIWLSSKSKMQLWGSLTENIYDGVNWCQKIFHHLFLLFKVGLAGSSAIVTATLKCLMHFFNLTETDLPKEVQPQFILDVEKSELHINAGNVQKHSAEIRDFMPDETTLKNELTMFFLKNLLK